MKLAVEGAVIRMPRLFNGASTISKVLNSDMD